MGTEDLEAHGIKAWAISSLLDLPAIHEAMTNKTDDEIIEFGKLAGAAESDGWKAHARAIGELQRRANYGDSAVRGSAEALGIHPKTAEKLGLIDRKILYPKLQELGAGARFPIAEKSFYILSCRLARKLKKSPLYVLKKAEEGRDRSAKYSTTMLKKELGLLDEKDPADKLGALLRRLHGTDEPVRKAFAEQVEDVADALVTVEGSMEVLAQLSADLRQRAEVADDTAASGAEA